MPYATNGGVTRNDMAGQPGWIQITEEQYGEGVDGMLAGQLVSIEGGFSLVDAPSLDPDGPDVPSLPAVPQVVSNAQGQAALVLAGRWSDVLAYVESIEDETQRQLAEIALHRTQYWQRNSPFLAEAAAAIGLTEAGVDALFESASQIQL